ncbi:MAG TPA: ATP-binding protein [Baekduia sp.]|nr:ATP-binding protein [Baekduia sp.]
MVSRLRLGLRSPVAQFALSGLVAMLVVGAVAVAASRHIGRDEAIRDAKQSARLAGGGIVEPWITRALLRGDPAAQRRLDAVVRARVLPAGIVRVKVWRADGTIVYSDEPRLIGARYDLGDEERAALRSWAVRADISDLTRPENRFERSAGKLLEVYLPIHAASGERVLFETYQPYSAVTASGRRVWLAFAPAVLGGLLVLWLLTLPLARSLAGRLRGHQREREALLIRSLDASEAERRRIAADLHDGVVQDLAGVSFALAADAQRLRNGGAPDPASGEAGAALARAAAQTRDSIRALRTLLVDIYPPSLHRSGLVAALADVARTHEARGLPTTLDAPAAFRAPAEVEQLLFRCAQEALRNVTRHADATGATITLREEDGVAHLVVRDDGRGFDPAAVGPPSAGGHVGLPALADLIDDAGGRFDVRSTPGAGTTVDVRVPLP